MTIGMRSNGIAAPVTNGNQRPAVTSEQRDVRFDHVRLRGWIATLGKRGLHVEIGLKPGGVVLHLRGSVDRQSAATLKGGFHDLLPFAAAFVDVDMVGVNRVDGMGLAGLIWAWDLARKRGIELRLTRMPPNVREIVMKMNLHHVLKIVEDRELLLVPE